MGGVHNVPAFVSVRVDIQCLRAGIQYAHMINNDDSNAR